MRFGFHSVYALVFLLCTTVSVQAAPKLLPPETTAAPAGTEAVLATGLTDGDTRVGTLEARLVKAIRDGDRLTVTVRFKPVKDLSKDESRDYETFYSSAMSENEWKQNFYLISGNKKYLILKDSDEKWLAPRELGLRGGTGSWSAIFPAPPAGQKATLHMSHVEPIGPFIVP